MNNSSNGPLNNPSNGSTGQPPSLLSAAAVAHIEEIRRSEPTAQCTLLTALRLVQQERRHIGVAEVEEVAALLSLSPALVDGVARFYDQLSREPTGAHVVAVCRGIACFLRGSGERADQIGRALGVGPGETTADGRVTVRLVECIGDCDHAPAVMLDDTFLGAVTADELRTLLDQRGQPPTAEGGRRQGGESGRPHVTEDRHPHGDHGEEGG